MPEEASMAEGQERKQHTLRIMKEVFGNVESERLALSHSWKSERERNSRVQSDESGGRNVGPERLA